MISSLMIRDKIRVEYITSGKWGNGDKLPTIRDIAKEYGVCAKTLNKWLKQNSVEVPRGLIYPSLKKKIYNKLGEPEKLD